MTNTKNKTLTTIALVLTLTIAALIAGLSTVNAAEVEIQPNIFVMFSPHPVGVGQSVLVNVQMDKTSPTVLSVEGGDRFTGFTVTITKPDGETEERGPYTAYATSGFFFFYTPNQIGTYTFEAHFPGQTVYTPPDYTGIGTTPYNPDTAYVFKPASSIPTELVVQEDQIQPYQETVISQEEYWERPINAENKGWWQIADNWLMAGYDYLGRRFPSYGAFAPYTSAPNSAHILWRRPLWFGGIVGGKFEDRTYYTGLSYEQPYEPIILQGRIIYVEHDPVSSGNIIGTRCLDLYTGEELWFMEDIAITFAQLLSWDSPNEHGIIAHLWSQSGSPSNTTYRIYDGKTGKYQFTITNVIGGDTIAGPNGEILNYAITGSGNNRRLIVWNSTKAILDSGSSAYPPPRAFEYYSVIQGTTVDGQYGIQMNVSLPNIPGPIKYLSLEEKKLVTHYCDPSTFPFTYVDTAYDTDTGSLLWTQNITNVHGHYGPTRLPYDPRAIRDGIRVIYDDSKLQLHGYDLTTGNEIWVTDPLPSGWAYFNQVLEIAYGKVYHAGYDGHVRAFNAETGDLEWDFVLPDPGYETPTGNYPIYAGFTIADNKIFFTNDEHSPDSVLWRGGRLYALNTDNGDELWSILGWFRIPVVADGYLTATNSLDGQIYCFGKGPSAMTVEAPKTAVPKGTAVMITGTITDQSAGAKGTPAIADEDMTEWMEHLYMQKPLSVDVKGVPVKLAYMLPDGSWKDIDETTSDMDGNFGYLWTPPDEGTYLVKAFFLGSESYGSSFGTTYVGVGPAPDPYPTDPGYQGPTAQEVAQNVLDNLPDDPTADDIAQEVLDQLPEYPEAPEAPDYTNIFIGIVVAIVVVAALVVYNIYTVRKQK